MITSHLALKTLLEGDFAQMQSMHVCDAEACANEVIARLPYVVLDFQVPIHPGPWEN